jgi:hypothetical protein
MHLSIFESWGLFILLFTMCSMLAMVLFETLVWIVFGGRHRDDK